MAKKKTEPTAAEWDEAIRRFQFFRRIERPDVRRRAKQLPELLSDIAQEVYDIANELERTNELAADLSKYGAAAVADRIALNGYALDVRDRFVPLEFLEGLPKQLTASPRALRDWAHSMKDEADRGQRLVDLYDECVERLRGSKKAGRFPAVSQFWFQRKADEWCVSIAEIARQLLKRNVLPESSSKDPNQQRQWEEQLKKARVRSRRRSID